MKNNQNFINNETNPPDYEVNNTNAQNIEEREFEFNNNQTNNNNEIFFEENNRMNVNNQADKIFSNQNLYFANLDRINNNYLSSGQLNYENMQYKNYIKNVDDSNVNVNFEKPFNTKYNSERPSLSRNNNFKFSNTEIPEVFDESYIQRRINKAEINSPYDENNISNAIRNLIPNQENNFILSAANFCNKIFFKQNLNKIKSFFLFQFF